MVFVLQRGVSFKPINAEQNLAFQGSESKFQRSLNFFGHFLLNLKASSIGCCAFPLLQQVFTVTTLLFNCWWDPPKKTTKHKKRATCCLLVYGMNWLFLRNSSLSGGWLARRIFCFLAGRPSCGSRAQERQWEIYIR